VYNITHFDSLVAQMGKMNNICDNSTNREPLCPCPCLCLCLLACPPPAAVPAANSALPAAAYAAPAMPGTLPPLRLL